MSCYIRMLQLNRDSSAKTDLIAWAFETSAMDYMLKPIAVTDLASKVRSALCKKVTQVQNEASEPYALADLTIDFSDRDESLGANWSLSNCIWRGGRE